MHKRVILLILSFVFYANIAFSQGNSTPSESRKANLKQLLDYRYRGGFYSFERLFLKTVEYPEYTKKQCVVGMMIVRFEVDCEGEIKNLIIKNPLRWGLDQQIEAFFQATVGNWNKCDDEKYTRFEVPIQFTINETETNSIDAMLVCQEELTGYTCKSDDYFREKLDKAIEKNSKKKAIKYISELIRRNPYDSDLYTLRTELVEGKKE